MPLPALAACGTDVYKGRRWSLARPTGVLGAFRGMEKSCDAINLPGMSGRVTERPGDGGRGRTTGVSGARAKELVAALGASL